MLQSYAKDTDTEGLKKEIKEEALAYLSEIIEEVSDLPETRRARVALMTKILDQWAGDSKPRQFVSQRIKKRTSRKNVGFEDESTDFNTLAFWRNTGGLIGHGIRYATLKNQENPEWLATFLRKPLHDLIGSIDFGDLYEMIASNEKRSVAVHQMLQDVMDDYQTKAGILPALKLKQMNTSLKKLNITLSGMDDVPPDMLAKTLFSFFDRIIEKQELGLLVAKFMEIIRKLRVGDMLEGEAGKGFSQIILTRTFEEILSSVDPVVMKKAMVGWAELREEFGSALSFVQQDRLDILMARIEAYFGIKNAKIRQKSRNASVWEECEEDVFAETVSRGLTDLDTQEMAEIVNTWLRVGNRLKDDRRDIAFSPLSSFVSALDRDELEEAMSWLVPDMVRALKPVAGTAMPELIKGFCTLLQPVPGQDHQEMDSALAMLRAVISGKEGGE